MSRAWAQARARDADWMAMSEVPITDTYKARFRGGPLDGIAMETVVVNSDDLPQVVVDISVDEVAVAYVLAQYSKLPPDGMYEGVHMMRGARYDCAGTPQFLRYRV